MIYVCLQNGSEFLLVGDVVWSSVNITQATGRPLLLRWMMHEDWEKNGNEIRALHDLGETPCGTGQIKQSPPPGCRIIRTPTHSAGGSNWVT